MKSAIDSSLISKHERFLFLGRKLSSSDGVYIGATAVTLFGETSGIDL